MKRIIYICFLAMTLSAPAWAVDDPSPSTVTAATWDIYGLVALAAIVALGYIFWHQKREKDREKRRPSKPA